MWSKKKYGLPDFDSFFKSIVKYVDTTEDYRQSIWIPNKLDKEYFGKFDWGKFTIYQTRKGLIKRYISLRIKAKLEDSKLSVSLMDYYLFGRLFNYLLIFIVSIVVAVNNNLIFGLIILVPDFLLLAAHWRTFEKNKTGLVTSYQSQLTMIKLCTTKLYAPTVASTTH